MLCRHRASVSRSQEVAVLVAQAAKNGKTAVATMSGVVERFIFVDPFP
jgi:hypothetical protein